MAIPSDALLRLTGRSPVVPGGPQLAGTPGYETLGQLAQQIAPSRAEAIIPQRYQGGGVAFNPVGGPHALSYMDPGRAAFNPVGGPRAGRGGDPFGQPWIGQPRASTGGDPWAAMPRPQWQPVRGQRPGIQFADGGVATDENDNPSWQPSRGGTTGMEATAPESYQDGGIAAGDYNRQQLMAYEQAMNAMHRPLSVGYQNGGEVSPQYRLPKPNPPWNPDQLPRAPVQRGGSPIERYATARPIYNAQMLASPPSKLSGYYGELSGYQDGGVTRPPYELPPEQTPEQIDIQNELEAARQGEPVFERMGVPMYLDPYERAYHFKRDIYPRRHLPRNIEFQGGGVVYPGVTLDPSGLPTLTQTQAPQQQSSSIAGETAKKKKPQQQPRPAQAQGQRQRFEFGPSDFYYSSPLMKKLMEQQEATLEKGMKEGGVIPKEFMQYLANGGIVKDFTPDHHLMFALGMKYALSPKQAAKRLKDGKDGIARYAKGTGDAGDGGGRIPGGVEVRGGGPDWGGSFPRQEFTPPDFPAGDYRAPSNLDLGYEPGYKFKFGGPGWPPVPASNAPPTDTPSGGDRPSRGGGGPNDPGGGVDRNASGDWSGGGRGIDRFTGIPSNLISDVGIGNYFDLGSGYWGTGGGAGSWMVPTSQQRHY